jgi:hypothetical protein
MSEDMPREDGRRRSLAGASPLAIGLLVIGLLLALALASLYLLGAGPFGPDATPAAVATPSPAGASPTPTASPPADTPSSTATPSADASPSPPATPPTPAPPPEAAAQLLTYVPADVRDGCIAVEDEEALAIATCIVDDGSIVVVYTLHASNATMQASYDALAAISEIEPDSGTCADPTTWPAEGGYSIEQRQAGRMLCLETGPAPTIYWTDDRLGIFSYARGGPGGAERLYDFWLREAGPTP